MTSRAEVTWTRTAAKRKGELFLQQHREKENTLGDWASDEKKDLRKQEREKEEIIETGE